MRIWDVGRRELTGVKFKTLAPSLEFSPDGRFLALAAFDRGFEIRDPATGEVVERLKTDDMARSVAFSPSGDLLATGYYDGLVQLWSTEDWRPVGPALEGHDGRILSLHFSPDGRTLASGSEDGTVLLRDVATQRPIGSALPVDPRRVRCRAVQPGRVASVRGLLRRNARSGSTRRSTPGSSTRVPSQAGT